MGRTKLTTRGADLDKLTDKMRRFVLEYPKDYNGTRAAKVAKYAHPEVAAAKLLKHPLVKAALGKIENQVLVQCEVDRNEIIQQLIYLATRDGKDFVDVETGLIKQVHDLPERASQAIDGIEQEVTTYTDAHTGEETRTVKTKLKLCSKLGAVEMAMKHKGLFPKDQIQTGGDVNVNLALILPAILKEVQERANVIDAPYIEEKANG